MEVQIKFLTIDDSVRQALRQDKYSSVEVQIKFSTIDDRGVASAKTRQMFFSGGANQIFNNRGVNRESIAKRRYIL